MSKVISYKAPLVLLAFLAMSLSFCSKRAQPTVFKLTARGELLVNKQWKETTIEVLEEERDSVNYQDITSQFMRSDLDDIITFKENGTYIFDEGRTKARVQSAQIYESGKWALTTMEDSLILSTTNSNTTYYIEDLSENKLVLSLPVKSKGYAYLLTHKRIE